MWFWYIMFFFCLQMPIIMFSIGFVWRKNPPKHINDFYGYRTKQSKLNQENWDFAHRYFGDLWYKLGVVVFLSTVIVYLFLYKLTYGHTERTSYVTLIIIFIQLFAMVVPIIPTEIKLKNKDLEIKED